MGFKIHQELVRRNITFHEFAAKNLKAMADFTGHTQGEILEMALNQPVIRRLQSFISSDNPIVGLLETYQCDEGHMSQRASEYILQCVKDWIQGNALVKHNAALLETLPYTNDYIYGHMTEYSMEADHYFKTVYDDAANGVFLTSEMSAKEIKEKVIVYINAIINGTNNKCIILESYLFRNLLIILDTCFEIPDSKDVEHMYHELSDGYVLPYIVS